MNEGSNPTKIAAPDVGDKATYESLISEHYRQVFAVCLGILANVHDAEDAAQETMLRGFLKMPGLRTQQGFRHWIVRVARNLCIDVLRKRRRPAPIPQEPPARSQQDDDALADLEQAVTRLPMELRIPLLMYYFDGRSAAGIAESLGVSHATACQRLRTARRELHERMTEGTDR